MRGCAYNREEEVSLAARSSGTGASRKSSAWCLTQEERSVRPGVVGVLLSEGTGFGRSVRTRAEKKVSFCS